MDVTQRNRSFGWWSLLCWLSLGMVLESMHGFKVGWYLYVVNDARRLQLSLAHTHGTLIALVNLAFAVAARAPGESTNGLERAGWCLRWAGMLMPAGFLLGGVFAMGPDPGFAIVLVPIGGLLLFAGVLLTARSMGFPAARSGAPVAPAKPESKSTKPTKQGR